MIYFSNNFKLLRKSKGYKQVDLAEILNVKPNTISNYENGVSEPSFEILLGIIKIFDVQSQNLLYTDLENIELEKADTPSGVVVDCNRCKDKDKTISALEKTVETLEKLNASLESDLRQANSAKNDKKPPYQQTG